MRRAGRVIARIPRRIQESGGLLRPVRLVGWRCHYRPFSCSFVRINGVTLGELQKVINLAFLPVIVAMKLVGHDFGNAWRHLDGRFSVQKEGASTSGQNVFDRSSHFMSNGPDDFGSRVGQGGMKRNGQDGIVLGNLLNRRGI